ncbi:MAG: iron-sulfur cluster assembly scaffold protein [Clostridia bacterium]|nr:iron-sulfur cluster assembly scaffold protein [Clostridia bacterium]
MYSKRILERFSNPTYAGGIRGGDGTGRAESGAEVVKIYISVNEKGEIENAKFKAYGGVCTIVACDVACQLIEDKTLTEALAITADEILEEMGECPENKHSSVDIALEAVKLSVEDYFEKRQKQLKKRPKNIEE